MTKLPLLATALFVAGIAAAAQELAPPPLDQFASDLAYFTSLYPRNEGSTGERRALDRIAERLQSLGVRYERSGMSAIEGIHSYSDSIVATLGGARTDELLVVVSVDQPADATDGAEGAINMALALGLLGQAARDSLPLSVKFLFLGAEYGAGSTYPLGSREFLADYFPDYPVAVLALDFQAATDRLAATAGTNRIVSPYWLINRMTAAFDRARLRYLLRGNQTQVFRLGLVDIPPRIAPYLEAGYPAIELVDGGAPIASAGLSAWYASFEIFFSAFLGENRRGFVTPWDRHYLFFQVRSLSIILTEEQYLLIFLAVLALSLVYPLAFKERFYRYLRALFRHLPSLPLLFAVVFLLLFLGTLAIDGIGLARNMPTIWAQEPVLFFLLKILLAMFLLALAYRLLRALPFAHSRRFYSAAVILLLLVDLFVVAIVNISLTYYVLWTFLWALLFAVARRRWVKALLLVVSTAWFAKGAFDIFTLPELEAVRVVLLSPVKGNLLVALTLLPFVLMVIALELRNTPSAPRPIGALFRTFEVLLGAVSAGLALYLLTFQPYDGRHLQPVLAREEIDLDRGTRLITLESPAPLRDLYVFTGDGAPRPVSTRSRVYSFGLTGAPDALAVKTFESPFLDRRQVDLVLTPAGLPNEVTVVLSAKPEIVILDSNFPFAYDPTLNTARIAIGKNPPVPLDVQFTVPQSAAVDVQIELFYNALPYALDVTGPDLRVTKEYVVRQRLSLPG